MAANLPTEADFDPLGGCPDAQCAWSHFGGLDLELAHDRFSDSPQVYQEDFMFMGGKAFAFYFPVIDRFLRESTKLSTEDRDDRQSWILPQCIHNQFRGQPKRHLLQLKPSILELCDFMLQHMEHFIDDWDPPSEIEAQWLELQSRVIECR